jgi:monolysocardiolipin acyltransferase
MLASVRGQRWVPGAKEVIFTNSLFTYYFSRGKLVPVVRGNGVYQEGMDFLISKLQDGAWVHIYPEGKIIADHSYIRHKWGVGRLVAECTETPTVIPLWHVGMDDLLPNRRPYIPQLFQKLTVLVGNPIDLSCVDNDSLKSAVVARRRITDVLERALLEVKREAEDLHHHWVCRSLTARKDL